MKTRSSILHGLFASLLLALLGMDGVISPSVFAAEEMKAPGMSDRQPPRSEDTNGRITPLTAEQVEQVKTILSKYDANTLTADKARAIHEAFRQAGLRGGPALNEAVKAAGFDPDKLRDLAPPPEHGGKRKERQPSRKGDGAQGGDDRGGAQGQESRGQNQSDGN